MHTQRLKSYLIVTPFTSHNLFHEEMKFHNSKMCLKVRSGSIWSFLYNWCVHSVTCHGDVTSNVPPSEHCVRVGTMLAILLCTSWVLFCTAQLPIHSWQEWHVPVFATPDSSSWSLSVRQYCSNHLHLASFPGLPHFLFFSCVDGSGRASVETKEQKNGLGLEIRLTCTMVIFCLSSRPSLPNICCLGWSEEPSHIYKPLFSFPVGTDFINKLVT